MTDRQPEPLLELPGHAFHIGDLIAEADDVLVRHLLRSWWLKDLSGGIKARFKLRT